MSEEFVNEFEDDEKIDLDAPSEWAGDDEDVDLDAPSEWADDDEDLDAPSEWGTEEWEDEEWEDEEVDLDAPSEWEDNDDEDLDAPSEWSDSDEDEDESEETIDSVIEESKSVGVLSFDRSKFSTYEENIKFSDLTYSVPLKDYRSDTFKGLTQSVSELGIVSPIHVMELESYKEHLENGGSDDDFEGEKYLLLDGFRRVFAGVKVGLDSCPAVVWSFKDSDVGREASVNLSLILNKNQKHNWKEIWGMFEVLELNEVMAPSSLEYLLQLESGDAMKLKDVMLCEYDEVKEDLLSNKKNLYQAYNQLQKLRKEEDKLQMEDNMGISVTESGEAVTEDQERPRLSDNEVKEVLDLVNSDDIEFSDDNFGEWSGEDIPDNWQDRKAGDRIDENLRQSILERDRFTCQVSGFGKGLKPHYTRKLLRIHHIIFVSEGGTDSEENLITLSGDIHDLLHIIVANNGKLGISKEDYEKLDENTKEMYKKLMKYVNIALEAKERLGKKGSDTEYKAEKRDPFWTSLEKE